MLEGILLLVWRLIEGWRGVGKVRLFKLPCFLIGLNGVYVLNVNECFTCVWFVGREFGGLCCVGGIVWCGKVGIV
jgi:hypothetical protein